ncbi:MAG TPA: hypothetical protein VJN93_11340 [Candidatus Acidoferrum sp.]|nr:hypothetical protein [Candidatus Acidoferrum sp.]
MPSKVAVCEKFRAELTDIAAARGEALSTSNELRVHLAECAGCRAWFEEERMLFSAIDAGVHAAVSAEVPASLLQRVRARLNERKAIDPLWMMLGAAVSATLLVLAISAFVGGHRKESINSNVGPRNVASHSAAADASPVSSANALSPAQSARPLVRETGAKATPLYSARRTNAPVEILVLVPAGRKAAVDAALLDLTKGTVKAGDLLLTKNEKLTKSDAIAPMEIQEMEIKPLATINDQTGSTADSTRF